MQKHFVFDRNVCFKTALRQTHKLLSYIVYLHLMKVSVIRKAFAQGYIKEVSTRSWGVDIKGGSADPIKSKGVANGPPDNRIVQNILEPRPPINSVGPSGIRLWNPLCISDLYNLIEHLNINGF